MLAEVRGVCATDATQVLMVATLILLALVVIGQSAVRDIKHQWACTATILSKHKFCVNVRRREDRAGRRPSRWLCR